MGHHRPASDTPSQWHFAGRADDGLFIAVFGSSIPLSTKKNFLDPRMLDKYLTSIVEIVNQGRGLSCPW